MKSVEVDPVEGLLFAHVASPWHRFVPVKFEVATGEKVSLTRLDITSDFQTSRFRRS